MPEPDRLQLRALANRVFTPRQPIRSRDLFAGRAPQLNRVVDAVLQAGAHVLIHGERGVGKTSLANCIAPVVDGASTETNPIMVAPVVNCETGDDFNRLWRRVLAPFATTGERDAFGFSPASIEWDAHVLDGVAEPLRPHNVIDALTPLAGQCKVVIPIDEFDRLTDSMSLQQTTDVLKGLSDRGIDAILCLVGVGDSVTALIDAHESISRHLIEVPLPRMSVGEQYELLEMRLPGLGLTIDDEARRVVVSIARGLPYYNHLLGLKASLQALSDGQSEITHAVVQAAIRAAIDDSEYSIRTAYATAVHSPRAEAKHIETLTACALASADEFGYFSPKDVEAPYSKIEKQTTSVSMFNKRLKRFTTSDRAEVLRMTGSERLRRYRFRDPMLQPFVVLKAIERGLIEFGDLEAIAGQPQQQSR